MSDYFQGKDGFIWWHGVVEDRKDPLFLGRCRIRILGWHTDNKTELPTEDLPWAYPLMPITSASQTGVGEAPVGPVEGTWVMGFYRDGELAQEPVFIGTLHGIPERYAKQNFGFNDPRLDDPNNNRQGIDETGESAPSGSDVSLTAFPYPPKSISARSGYEATILEYTNEERKAFASKSLYPRELDRPTTSKYARGKRDTTTQIETQGVVAFKNANRLSAKIIPNFAPNPGLSSRIGADEFATLTQINTQTEISQPPTPYNAVYPFNHVYESESGHLIEVDDTPTKERLHWFHRSGTFTEFHPKGSRTERTMGHRFNMVTGNAESIIQGTEKKNVSVDSVLAVGKNLKHIVGRDYLLSSNDGNISIDAPSGITTISGNQVFIDAKNTLVLKGTQIVRDDDSAQDEVKGNYSMKAQGEFGVQGGKLSMASLGQTSISSFGPISQLIGGNSEEVINNTDFVLGNTNAKLIRAVLGKIVLESVNGLFTGGIDMTVGPGGLNGKIAIDQLGNVTINSTTGTSGVTVEAVAQAVLKGLIKAVVQGALVEIKADALCQIDGQLITVGGQSEPMILGKTFLMDIFKDHQHPSSVGPTGPVMPQYAAKIVQAMSKKCFLG